ncbi:DUF2569 domain-containing protein [Cedecea neteri]|uniref:DUF2569 domain-containing protein n=1 Tax=Cedecea neteri TaxID=158822 RepID=UPI002AA863B5|nr:DUF2569 domain-containing protein [Cedecea neteri]WPU24084.1 DUF2569 domain-containing protein [Cedecea neteri]
MQCIACQQHVANKESGLCVSCERLEEKKINGLLYLPAAGIVFSLFLSGSTLYGFITAIIDYYQRMNIITFYAVGAVSLNTIDLLTIVAAAYYFFKRKKGVRKVMIAYYLMGVTAALYIVGLPAWLGQYRLDYNDIRNMSAPLIAAVIWIPYFLFSKRINAVFCR